MMLRTLQETTRMIEQLPIRQEQREAITKKANRLGRDCGCEAGAVSMLTALLAVFFLHPFQGGLLHQAAITLGISLMVGMAGKMAGILVSRFRLKRLMKELVAMQCSPDGQTPQGKKPHIQTQLNF